MQTSFIPKKPMTESHVSSSGISLFLLLSIILFIATIALALGVWLWQGNLTNKITADKEQLISTKNKYETDTDSIESLIRLNDLLNVSTGLLANHLAVDPIFTLLEQNTIQNVQLKSMKFSYGGADKIKLDLSGVAKNYDALSKQSDAFGSEQLRQFISQPVVSDFSLNPDGTVSFNFSALIDSKLVSYENSLPGATGVSNDTGTTTSPNQ